MARKRMTRAEVAACHFEMFHPGVYGPEAKAAEMDSNAFSVAFMLVAHELGAKIEKPPASGQAPSENRQAAWQGEEGRGEQRSASSGGNSGAAEPEYCHALKGILAAPKGVSGRPKARKEGDGAWMEQGDPRGSAPTSKRLSRALTRHLAGLTGRSARS